MTEREPLTLPDRVPPQDLSAEQSTLGSALISGNAADTVLELLRREDFYLEAHGKVYEAIATLRGKDQPADLLTVPAELRRRNWLETVGGISYLSTLENSVPTAAHVLHYARIVQEKSRLRKLIHAAGDVIARAYEEADDAATIGGQAEEAFYQALRERRAGDFLTAGDLAARALDTILGEKLPEGPKSGYGLLDYYTGGWKPGRLGVLAGRPGSGKTAIMCNFAYRLAKAGVPVGMFSTEMDRDELQTRLIAIASGVDSRLLETQCLADDDRDRAKRANMRLADLPLYVNDAADLTLMGLRGQARRLSRQRGVKLIIVDYLQRILPEGRGEMDHRHFTRVAESCKSMARELGCFVLALSQLSRNSVEKGKKDDNIPPPPQPHHLRESGGIEQAADLILMLHRPAYYLRQLGQVVEGPDPTDVLIAKNRQGREGKVELFYFPESLRFADAREAERSHSDQDAPPERERRAV